MRTDEIYGAIEAILYVCGDAVKLKTISEAIDHDEKTTERFIQNLSDRLNNGNGGIRIIKINDSYQMCTNPACFPYISSLGHTAPQKTMTLPLLETLAIIAYKQPVTKSVIERIRGVDASHTVNKLIEYELVTEAGREDCPGRPIIFKTTDKFLSRFGFTDINQLPGIGGNDNFA